jgi:AraC-like DNA-binding protein
MPRRNTQIAMQRAASLVPLASLLADFGIEIVRALRGTGIAAGQLRQDSFIPYAAFLAILDNACSVTGREDIGMLLGQRQTLEALGPLGSVMRHAATLGEAIAEFTAFQINNSTGGAVYLMRSESDVVLGYGVYGAPVRVTPQIYDMVLAVGCNLIAELTRGAVGPDEILISRAAPADPAPYLRLGHCPIRFGQNQTGLLLRASTLAFRLPDADRDQHDRAVAGLVSVMDGTRGEVHGRVRHLLRPLLLMGKGGMEDMAERLGMHPRALRRRLAKEGTTLEAIKDEVRFAAARELLMLGDLNIIDIAVTLDYATASSFVHAFRRWSGMSPGRWRANAR